MLNQINASDLLVALSDQQQEIVTGGADFELAASNYANKGSLLMGTSVSGPQGSSATSAGKANTILTAGQDFLGLGAEPPSTVGALGPAGYQVMEQQQLHPQFPLLQLLVVELDL